MSKKRRGRTGKKPAVGQDGSASQRTDSSSDEAPAPEGREAGRHQRRSEKIRRQRESRRSAEQKKQSQGLRPWILPGFVGIAVLAVVLVGVATLNSAPGESAGADVPNPRLGRQTAQVVIHEYGDFQCPFCGVFSRTIKPELQAKYLDTGIATLVWHDFAWYGQESLRAANAARCAGEQDRFWEYHDLLFENQRGTNQGHFDDDNLRSFAQRLGLEAEPFEQCFSDDRYRDEVASDIARARGLGINGTPSFVIGDRRIVGAQPVEVFEAAIEAELLRAG